MIGASLRLPNEDKDPFAYLRLVEDCNCIDIHQACHRIKSFSNYMDQIMTTHCWEASSKKDNINTTILLRSDVLDQLSNNATGPKEGTKDHIVKYKINTAFYIECC